MEKKFRLGLVTRCDDSGLGSLSQDFYKYLEPEKVMTVYGKYNNHPERFPGAVICNQGIPSLQNIEDFLKDIDVMLTFETPYNWNLISKAKEKGIKTVIIPNYEWTTAHPPVEPDLWLCPSRLDYKIFQEEGRVSEYLPIPIDRTKIPFKLRTKALTFVFNNGHGGSIGRNSAKEVLEAMWRIAPHNVTGEGDPKFIFRSQVQLDTMLKMEHISFQFGDFPKEKLFEDGDMLIFPHKFDGLSLPIQEAIAAGMPVLTTDYFPFNEMLPKELMIPYDDIAKARLDEDTREINIHLLYSRDIAKKIEEFIGKDITELSKKMNEIAESFSWFTLKDKYIELLNNVCQK